MVFTKKKQSYVDYLDSLLVNPSLINKNEKEVLGQYYRLKETLKHYKEIEKKVDGNLLILILKQSRLNLVIVLLQLLKLDIDYLLQEKCP